MDYNETIDFLYHQLPVFQREGKAAYKANLNNTLALDDYFGHPHQAFRTIHVAGTNGKGSVSHMLCSVLQEAGYKVGLYTSPHLLDMRERIKVNGQMCSQLFVVDFVEYHMDVIQRIKPSFFELMVLMAFRYFQEQKVDVAVVEVGMGGRLDSTNIITPELSVITNIGLDHTQFLGDSLAQIATEKGGIIKPGIPVVIGEKHIDTHPVFERIAVEKNSKLVFAEEQFQFVKNQNAEGKQQLTYTHQNEEVSYFMDLLGSYQKKNLATALTAIEVLKSSFQLSQRNIEIGLKNVIKNTSLLGRWQVLGENPTIICDTGHNKEGLLYVVEQLKRLKAKKLHLVLGLVNEKDAIEILRLFPSDASFYITKANIPRAMPVKDLIEAAGKLNLTYHVEEKVEWALKLVKKNAGMADVIFIGGSTFVVAEALEVLQTSI